MRRQKCSVGQVVLGSLKPHERALQGAVGRVDHPLQACVTRVGAGLRGANDFAAESTAFCAVVLLELAWASVNVKFTWSLETLACAVALLEVAVVWADVSAFWEVLTPFCAVALLALAFVWAVASACWAALTLPCAVATLALACSYCVLQVPAGHYCAPGSCDRCCRVPRPVGVRTGLGISQLELSYMPSVVVWVWVSAVWALLSAVCAAATVAADTAGYGYSVV